MTLVGPVAEDPGWQARAGAGFEQGSVGVEWDRRVVTCPAGKESLSWLPNTYPKNGVDFPERVRFARGGARRVPRGRSARLKQEPRIIGLPPPCPLSRLRRWAVGASA